MGAGEWAAAAGPAPAPGSSSGAAPPGRRRRGGASAPGTLALRPRRGVAGVESLERGSEGAIGCGTWLGTEAAWLGGPSNDRRLRVLPYPSATPRRRRSTTTGLSPASGAERVQAVPPALPRRCGRASPARPEAACARRRRSWWSRRPPAPAKTHRREPVARGRAAAGRLAAAGPRRQRPRDASPVPGAGARGRRAGAARRVTRGCGCRARRSPRRSCPPWPSRPPPHRRSCSCSTTFTA